MKTVVFISMADLYYGNSAAVVRVTNYSKALALANINSLLLSTHMNLSGPLEEKESHIFVPPRNAKNLSPLAFYSLARFVTSIKKIVGCSCDDKFVIFNYSSSKSLFLDILLLLFFGSSRVFCEINEVRKYASDSNSGLWGKFYCFLLEKTYRLYAGAIFISKHIQSFYSDIVKNNIIIPILSDCSHPLPIISEFSDKESFNIVFLGTVSFAKENLNELIEGFFLFVNEYSQSKLTFYGPISGANKEKLERMISKSPLHIFYGGSLPHKEVSKVLAEADVLVIPRTNNSQNFYGFSTKLSEFAVSGVPIIMTDTGVVTDYFQNNVSCILSKGYDRHSFKDCFIKVASMSSEQRRFIAENAYKVALNYFDFRNYSTEISKFLFNNF